MYNYILIIKSYIKVQQKYILNRYFNYFFQFYCGSCQGDNILTGNVGLVNT